MKLTEDLKSGSSVKIRSAAKKAIENKGHCYCQHLASALADQIKKPKAWKTQCTLIRALALTECTDSLPQLKSLIKQSFSSTIVYRELAFAIFLLENTTQTNLSFFYESAETSNSLVLSGICAALLYKKIIPTGKEMITIIKAVSKHTENEGSIITPRAYIASLAYLWPIEYTSEFLESCKKSKWDGLVKIANASLLGKKSDIVIFKPSVIY